MNDAHLIIPAEILSALEAGKDDSYIIGLINEKISKNFGEKSLEKASDLLNLYKELIEDSEQ